MKLGLDYDKLNHTELIEICRKAGHLHVGRGAARKDLIAILEGDDHIAESCGRDPINEYRDAMLHMQELWPIVRRQLDQLCAPDFYACWLCPAGRVLYCIAENCDEGLLEQHGLPIPKRGKKGNKSGKKGG